ncbi:MAG: metallophosphoesterase, partial [Planctomycetes bacterium]|nr:metallophosphoesterase [Planctomycetota bacterium]
MVRKLIAFGFVIGIFSWLLAQDGEKPKPFELTIIHVNDNHAHHEPLASGDGGDARQATVIKQIRAAARNHVTLDAGDRFMGTLFHTLYKGMDNVPFLNKIGFQALAVGNHEFDEGDEGLAKFADALKCPILAANLDVSKSKLLSGKIHPFTIITVGGEQIGIIGLVTTDTKTGSRPSADIGFDRDYAAVVQKYVDELTKQKINKIVVLSHIGLSEDLKLASKVSGVDVIVGGHSHTLLSKTYREAKNTYPMKVNDKDGNPVYIVQAGGGDNRFVGKLDLEFDAKGLVTKVSGDTILLSKFITPDPEIQAEVDKLAK